MKKKNITQIVFVSLCLLFMVVVIAITFIKIKNEQESKQQWLIHEYYRQQNKLLPRISGLKTDEYTYRGYETVDEAKLYVYLAAYNECIETYGMNAQKLELEDIKDYLSSEYNADGSLRIYNTVEDIRYENYPHIYSYVEWYHECDGDEDITEYWTEIDKIIDEYRIQNPEIKMESVFDLSVDQLQELINKKNDSSYEINIEVMKGSN